MVKIPSYILLLIQLIWSVNSDHTKFPSEYDPVRIDIISKRDFNISKIVNGILFDDWMDNIHCLVELNAIKFGLSNFDEWAIKSSFFNIQFLIFVIIIDLTILYFYSCGRMGQSTVRNFEWKFL